MKKIVKFFSTLLLFVMTATSTLAFSDVPPTAWYLDYVNELRDKKIIDDAPLYNPFLPLKRAELVKMVINGIDGLEGYEAPNFPTFYDVPLNEWFSPFVEEAATRKIVNGYADQNGNFTGFFGPGDTVTRAAAVKVMVKAFDLKSQGNMMTPAFSDVMPSDWFYPYLDIAASLGIIEGYSDGTFQGNKEVSRSEISKMLVLSMNAEAEAENPELPNTPTVPDPEEEEDPETPTTEIPATPNNSPLVSSLSMDGEKGKLIARYHFQGNNEGFYVDTITLANDTTGTKIGDESESSLALKNVTIKYPDKNNMLQTATTTLKSDGTARFSNLDFYIKKDVNSFLEVYADLNSFGEIGADLSGEQFRVGLKDINATSTDFKAVGEFSGDVITLGNGALVTTTSDLPTFTMKKSRPTFAVVTPSASLLNGNNALMSLKVTADASGSIGLGRVTFLLDVTDEDNANLTLSNFKFFSGSNAIDTVNIYDATGAQDLKVGSLTQGTATVIVSFNQEEIVSAGDSKTYHLKADVTGAANDDSISTSLASGDDNSPLSGLAAYEQESAGKIFVNADATAGIFTGATDFSQMVGANKNILWSDFSFQPHQYPQVANGSVTTGTGSKDWTNGYKLGIMNLSSSVLSK